MIFYYPGEDDAKALAIVKRRTEEEVPAAEVLFPMPESLIAAQSSASKRPRVGATAEIIEYQENMMAVWVASSTVSLTFVDDDNFRRYARSLNKEVSL